MKKRMIPMLVMAVMTTFSIKTVKAQSVTDVIEELMLDYQKLAGMKSTLNQMYHGYAVLTRGYDAVRGVSMDNFNLHKAFLDAQLFVSPAIRSCPRTGDIIRNQQTLMAEYHSAKRNFDNNQLLTASESQFMSAVYSNLTRASSDNLAELERVTSDGRLRMTDAERLRAIDRLYLQSEDQLSYLRKFNEQVNVVIRQRQAAERSRQLINTWYH